jgi:VIT1/CCC1 family predicted Fe2+/Mn2+ transporter
MLSLIIGLILTITGLYGASYSRNNPVIRFLVMVGIFFIVFGLYSCTVRGW